MNLSGIWQGRKSVSGASPAGSAKGSSASLNVSASGKAGELLRSVAPGQTVQGEIVGRNGNEVQIKVGRDAVITARLDQEMSLVKGQILTFEVRGNGGSQISLRPLFENLSQDPNILKALNAAGLPANDAMIAMVSALMDEGMPIDKASLLEMSRQILNNPGSNPAHVVALTRLDIPVTSENLEQFAAYKNLEHQITGGIEDILRQFPETFQNLASQGKIGEAVGLYQELLSLFAGGEAGPAQSQGLDLFTPDGLPFPGSAAEPSDKVTGESGSGRADKMVFAEEGLSSTDKAEAGRQMLTAVREAMAGEGLPSPGETDIISETAVREGVTAAEEEGGGARRLDQLLTPQERGQLGRLLGRLGFSESFLAAVRKGEVSPEQLLSHILRASQTASASRSDVAALFGSSEFHQVLTEQVAKQWLLRPLQVGEERQVEELYNRLREQTAKLTEAIGEAAGKDTALFKSVTSLQHNVEFMNQLNQTFTYVQLPLKLSGGNAHGDLYVYTNKKNLASREGKVSALLHLDMEHLGPVDVYVAMQDNRVNTQFYLKDDRTIDLIAANIHILNERLEKRGYTMTAEMKLSESETNVMEEILKKDQNKSVMSRYSFDVRA